MKKIMEKIACVMTTVILALSLTTGAQAAQQDLKVKVDGREILFPDAQPYVNEDNRTMVPVRFITEALGFNVQWEDGTQLVIITKQNKRVVLKIGEKWAIVNDTNLDAKNELDTKAVLKDERTFVPLRFISEVFGLGVSWDEGKYMVILRSDGVVEETPKVIPVPTSALDVKKRPLTEGQTVIEYGKYTQQEYIDNFPIVKELINSFDGKIQVASSEWNPANSITVYFVDYQESNNVDIGTVNIEYYKNKDGIRRVTIDAARYNEKTLKIIKKALELAYPDDSDLRDTVYNEIIYYRENPTGKIYQLNDNYWVQVSNNRENCNSLWPGEGFGVTYSISKGKYE